MNCDVWYHVVCFCGDRAAMRLVCRELAAAHARWAHATVDGLLWRARVFTGAPAPLGMAPREDVARLVALSPHPLRVLVRVCDADADWALRSCARETLVVCGTNRLLMHALARGAARCARYLISLTPQAQVCVAHACARRSPSVVARELARDLFGVEAEVVGSVSAAMERGDSDLLDAVAAARAMLDDVDALHRLWRAGQLPPRRAVAAARAAGAHLPRTVRALCFLVRRHFGALSALECVHAYARWAPVDVAALVLRRRGGVVTVENLVAAARNPDERVAALLLKCGRLVMRRGADAPLRAAFKGTAHEAAIGRVLSLFWLHPRCTCPRRSAAWRWWFSRSPASAGARTCASSGPSSATGRGSARCSDRRAPTGCGARSARRWGAAARTWCCCAATRADSSSRRRASFAGWTATRTCSTARRIESGAS